MSFEPTSIAERCLSRKGMANTFLTIDSPLLIVIYCNVAQAMWHCSVSS